MHTNSNQFVFVCIYIYIYIYKTAETALSIRLTNKKGQTSSGLYMTYMLMYIMLWALGSVTLLV